MATALPLRSQFGQAVFRDFDLPLKGDDSLEPRAGIHAGVSGLASKVLIELPKAPLMSVELLVKISAPAHELVEGFSGNRLSQLWIGANAPDAIQDGCLYGLRGNRLRLAILPALLLGVVADVVAITFRPTHCVGVHHRRPARHAEEQAAQESTQFVPDGSALVAAISPKRFVDLVPGLLIDDSVVLTRIENALVINHSCVQDVGQGRVQRASSEYFPTSDLAVFGGLTFSNETEPLDFLKDRQR